MVDSLFFGVIVNYNTTSSIASQEAAMPNRLIPLLALAAALYGTGAIIVSLSSLTGHRDAAVTAAPAAGQEALPVLPAVIVRPEPEIPVLAMVTVRPDRSSAASDEAPAAAPLGALAVHASSSALLPSGGFDMPYYSFGRTLHRVSKE